MRRSVDSFRGEIPRVTPRALPDNASRGAVNPRLLSGDAEQWRQFMLTEVLENAGAVRTIYLLAGEFWLSWEEDVDVAKGVIPGDTTHRTYITGLDLPRWTNVAMATGGAKPWPFETRPLGVPPPDASPTLVVGVDTSSSATFSVDVLDTGDTPLPWNFSPFSEFHGGVRFAFQDSGFGNPAGSYQLLYDDNPGAPAYAIRDFGIGAAAVVTVSWDAQMTSGSNNQAQMCAGLMRAADGANGLLIYFDLMSNQLAIGVAPGWQRIGQSGLASDASSVGFAFDAWYSFTASIVVNSNNTITVTAKAFLAAAEVASVTTTLGATLGGYVGFYAEVDGNDPNGGNDGVDRYRTYIDNIHVQASGTAGYAPQNVATSYLITFVNDVGEESAPSLPSATVLRPDGVSITVTSTTSVPTGVSADYHITTKRIYRAVTGSTGSAFRFVAEIPLAQADYVDVLPDSQLGEVLETDGWDLPPDDLRGILALPNGIMVGYRENEICLTPKNRPHAWPISFRLATDKKVVAIGAIDALVVVGTEGNPYLAGGNDPSQYSMTKLQVPQACVAKRGLASLGDFGVVFPSPDGLIAIAGTGQWKNLTSSVFTRDQWQALNPSSIVAVAHDDVYHFFYDVPEAGEGGYALDMKPDGFGLIQLGYHAVARFADPVTDNLYLVLDQVTEPDDDMLPIAPTPPTPDSKTIFQFNSPDSEAFLTYRWQSKLYLLERPGSFQFCRVDANNYDNLVLRMYRQVQLISPGNVWLDSLVYELVVRNDKPFTLPTRNQYRRFWFELVGTSSVQGVHFGESIEEVA